MRWLYVHTYDQNIKHEKPKFSYPYSSNFATYVLMYAILHFPNCSCID